MVAAEHSLAGHVVILRFYSTGTIIVVFTVPWFAVAVIYSSTHIAGYCVNTTYTRNTFRVLVTEE